MITIIVLLILAGISVATLMGDNSIIIRAVDANHSTKYSKYKEEVDLYIQGKLVENLNDGEAYKETITDKTELKKIMPDATDEDLEKLSIQKGKLVYDPDKVSNSEKNLMESIGILAVAGSTIIFIVNGQEFARIRSNKIKFPTETPVPNDATSYFGGYTFVGWRSDAEMRLYDGNTDYAPWWVLDEEGNREYSIWDWQYSDDNKVSEGDEVEEDEIKLYAEFRANGGSCLAEGTSVTLADGKKKNIEEITYGDSLLVWNFDEGKIDSAKPIWIMKKQVVNKYTQLKFDNGVVLKIAQHRIFNVDKQEFTHAYIDKETPIGTTVFMEDGTTAKLIERKEIEEEANVYNVITKEHINLFAEGILTSVRFNDMYEIKDMKFVKEERALNKKEDYANIPDKYFEGLRLAEQKNTIETSGKTWWEERVLSVIMKNEKTND